MKRIIIINQALSNHGDEAAHKALVRMLARAYPAAEITVLLHVSPKISDDDYVLFKPEELDCVNYHRIDTDIWYYRMMHYFWWLPTFITFILARILSAEIRDIEWLFRSADLVVNAPGGVDLGPYRNWNNVFRLLLALQSKTKTAIYSISFGPLPNDNWKDRRFSKLAKAILRQVDFLSLRDDKSQKFAHEMAFQFIPSADTAFIDEIDHRIPDELVASLNAPFAVVVPNAVFNWHPHFKHISKDIFDRAYQQMINFLIDKGLRVVMLPQLFGSQKDERYFHELSKGFPESSVEIIPDYYSSEVQQAIIRQAKFLVGARYHSVIFSIKNQIPFLGLSYEHKITNLLTIAGLEDLMIDLHDLPRIGGEGVCEKINNLLENGDEIRRKVSEGYSVVRRLAEETSRKFVERFP